MRVEHCLQSSAQGRCDGGLSSGYVDGLNVVLMEAPRAVYSAVPRAGVTDA